MRLTKVTLQGFRSIKGKESLHTDERVTIIIGANDHGKSNLLDAILCLNDDCPIESNDRNWDLNNQAPVTITWHFLATADEASKLRGWGPVATPRSNKSEQEPERTSIPPPQHADSDPTTTPAPETVTATYRATIWMRERDNQGENPEAAAEG